MSEFPQPDPQMVLESLKAYREGRWRPIEACIEDCERQLAASEAAIEKKKLEALM